MSNSYHCYFNNETTTNFDFSIEIHKIETLSSHRDENMLPFKLISIYMDEEGSSPSPLE